MFDDFDLDSILHDNVDDPIGPRAEDITVFQFPLQFFCAERIVSKFMEFAIDFFGFRYWKARKLLEGSFSEFNLHGVSAPFQLLQGNTYDRLCDLSPPDGCHA